MPVTHEILGETLALRMVGKYEPADIRTALATAFSGERADGVRGLLFDVSQSTSLRQRDARGIRAMAAFLAHLAARYHLRIALVGTSDLAFGLMRLGAADLEAVGVDTWVFRTNTEAERWLAE